METFHSGRWRDSPPIGHRRGAMHGMDRGSFNNHVPNQNPPPLLEKSWRMNSVTGEPWTGSNEHFCPTNSPSPTTYNDFQENGYSHQWGGGGGGGSSVTNGPRMDFHLRGNNWRGRPIMRSDEGSHHHHHHHPNPVPQPPPSPLFRGQPFHHTQQHQQHPVLRSPIYNTPPDISSPTGQDPRMLEGPLSSFPSPSSTESEGSPLPRDPRDPRQRSYHSLPASPLYNYQERKLSPSLDYPNAHHSNNSHGMPYRDNTRQHSYDPRSSHQHEMNYIQPPPSNHGHHFSGMHGSESSRRGRLPGLDDRESYHHQSHFSPRPPIIKETPNKGLLRTRERDDQLMADKNRRLLIEHSYFHRGSNTNSLPKPQLNSKSGGSSVLMPCNSTDIPLLTYTKKTGKQLSDTESSSVIMDARQPVSSHSTVGKLESQLSEETPLKANTEQEAVGKTSLHDSTCVSLQEPEIKDESTSETSTGCSIPKSSRNETMSETRNDSSTENRSDSTPQLEVESLTQAQNDNVEGGESLAEKDVQKESVDDLRRKEFSVSPLSLLGFEIDLDTEVESSASSSPTILSDDEVALPLFVSFPLSKVSLPTKMIIKSSLAAKTHLLPIKQQQQQHTMHHDTMQLRNRALRRNLCLYASRKTPVKVKEKADETNDDSNEKGQGRKTVVKFGQVYDDDGVVSDVSPSDDVHSSSIVLSDGGEEMSVKSDGEMDVDTVELSHLRSGNKRSSESPSTVPPSKRTKRTPTPEVSSSSSSSSSPQQQQRRVTRQQQRFQDFVPVVLRSRSRAESKTIQRRHKMVIEMQKHEKERKDTARPGEKEEEEVVEEVVPYRTRRRTRRRRDKSSPTQSLDDSSSIISESVSSKDQESASTQGPNDFSPELVRRCKFVVQTRDRSGSGDSPLHHVCRKGKYDMLWYFLTKENYSINIQDNAGWTPLHEACNNGHKDIVQVLLQNGADPNLPARDGTRPIHDAVEAGNFDIVSILVQNGADPLVEYSERTPLELAKSAGHPEIVAFLSDICEKRRKSKEQPGQPGQTASTNSSSHTVNHTSSDHVILPVNGYTEPLLGPELDQPVLYISAIIEMSSKPLLPVYNITVSSGSNPRKHNFHLLSDVLDVLDTTEKDLLCHLSVKTYSIPVEEFIAQMKGRQITKNAKILQKLKCEEKGSTVELIPVCEGLRELMGIVVENIDD